MSRTYNPVTKTFTEDAPNSNVTTPADPKTGHVTVPEGVELIGGPIEGKPNCFHRGRDFMSQQIQVGAHVIVAGDEYVCKSPGSVYEAYWEKLVAEAQ